MTNPGNVLHTENAEYILKQQQTEESNRMTNTKDDFDIEDLTDLPLVIRKKVKVNQRLNVMGPVMKLFRDRNILSIDEVLVALYRRYKIGPHRSSLHSSLNNLVTKGYLRKVGMGTYEITE
jgi:hypothetical protein